MNPTESNLAGFGEFLKQYLTSGMELKQIGHADGYGPVDALILPEGLNVQSVKKLVDEYRQRPERREGTAVMQDLESFIGHVNRFKDSDTALFADANRDRPSLLAVIDYHQAVNEPDSEEPRVTREAMPRFGRHRTVYQFPISREWQAWQGRNGQGMTQVDFAAFLEERGMDILPAPVFDAVPLSEADARLKRVADLLRGKFAGPERMMDLSRGLAVHESSKVMQATNLSSGEGAVIFQSEHTDEQGQKLEVPNLFCIGVPVFEHGGVYRVLVRLRYRKTGSGLQWSYDLYRADVVFDDALKQACDQARDATGLPLFVGKPETGARD